MSSVYTAHRNVVKRQTLNDMKNRKARFQHVFLVREKNNNKELVKEVTNLKEQMESIKQKANEFVDVKTKLGIFGDVDVSKLKKEIKIGKNGENLGEYAISIASNGDVFHAGLKTVHKKDGLSKLYINENDQLVKYVPVSTKEKAFKMTKTVVDPLNVSGRLKDKLAERKKLKEERRALNSA